MEKIKRVTVEYTNGQVDSFEGSGSIQQHATVVKGDKPRDDKDVRWVAVSLLRTGS